MTLVASGDLHLKGTSEPNNESIEYEVQGARSGDVTLVELQGDADPSVGSLPIDMTDFYGHEQCAESTPAVPTGVNASWAISGVIQVYFTKPGDADGIDIQQSDDNATWVPLQSGYTGSSPFSTSTSCFYEYFRVRSYNCAGSSAYSSGAWAGPCPP